MSFGPSQPVGVLGSEVGWESPAHLGGNHGNPVDDGKSAFDHCDQTGLHQMGEISGQPHVLSLSGRVNQA